MNGSLQVKNGKYYAVIDRNDAAGKRKGISAKRSNISDRR